MSLEWGHLVLCVFIQKSMENMYLKLQTPVYQMQYDLSYMIIKNLEDNPKDYKFTLIIYIKYGSVVSERDYTLNLQTRV